MNTINFIIIILFFILATYLICDIKYRSLLAKKNGLESQLDTIQQQNERLLAELLAAKVPEYVEKIKKKKLPDPPRPDFPPLEPLTAHERYKAIKKQERLERKKK